MAAGAAAGAAIGVAGTKALVTSSIDKSKMKEVGAAFPTSSSGLVVVYDALPIDKALWKSVEVQQTRDEILYQLAKDLGDSLRAGQDVAYMYAVTEEGVIATRMVAGEEALNLQGLIATDASVAGGEVTLTENAIVYEVAGADATDVSIEAAYDAGVITEDGKAAIKAHVAAAAVEDTPSSS